MVYILEEVENNAGFFVKLSPDEKIDAELALDPEMAYRFPTKELAEEQRKKLKNPDSFQVVNCVFKDLGMSWIFMNTIRDIVGFFQKLFK